MTTDDFFRSRLDQMINLQHPLAVLAGKMPWEQIEQALAPVFERVIVDSTVSEKAIAYPTDNRLLEIARYQLVKVAKAVGIQFKQSYASEGKILRNKAAGYAHAKQFRRLNRTLKRQRTILGIVIRETQRKLEKLQPTASSLLDKLNNLIHHAQRVVDQKPKDKNKPYALHAPEVECIGKGKARQPYEFGIKAGFVVIHKKRLIIGGRIFPDNPYDGHTLAKQLEQTRILIGDHDSQPKQVYVDWATEAWTTPTPVWRSSIEANTNR